MTQLSFTLPTLGNDNDTEDPLIRTALSDTKTAYNTDHNTGGHALSWLASGTSAQLIVANSSGVPTYRTLTNATLSDTGALTNVSATALADAAKLGLSDGSSVRRGKSIIDAAETTSSQAHTTLATPDQVQNVVLPTDGFVCVLFQAQIKRTSGTGIAEATVYLGNNEVKVPFPGTSGDAVNVATSSDAYTAYFTNGAMLQAYTNTGSDVTWGTTGMTTGGESGADPYPSEGGPLYIWAAAGTYTVSVKYRTSDAGTTLSARYRKLWVWTMGF